MNAEIQLNGYRLERIWAYPIIRHLGGNVPQFMLQFQKT